MNPIKGKRILLGVTGSIACYKAADLASKLTQLGAEVDVILTSSGQRFVQPITFQSVTGRKAYTESDLWNDQGHVQHIGLGHEADLIVVAPVTANTMAKLAHGIADNLLTVTALAADCPLILAPAMDGGMFTHAATQANLKTLIARGAVIAGPEEGRFASGMVGLGRMSEPETILGHIRQTLGADGLLAGKKIVVTAGGTQEPLDPVRYLTNRSSGKQGYALAQAAVDLGAETILISAPTALTPPVGATLVPVQTAAEMDGAVKDHATKADALLMAAAVADFRPGTIAAEKIKKGEAGMSLEMNRTTDILAGIGAQKQKTGFPKVLVGFAAESEDLIANAEKKLSAKSLDLIAANDISAKDAGFGVDTNRITLLFADGRKEELPLTSKAEAAARIMSEVTGLLKKGDN